MQEINLKLETKDAEILQSLVDSLPPEEAIQVHTAKTSYGYAVRVDLLTAEQAFFLGMAFKSLQPSS